MITGSLAAFGDSTGSAGADIRWTLDNYGNLSFTGSGQMKDFGRSLPYRPQLIKNVTVQEGITNISANAFNGCSNLESVKLPSTIRSIGNNAFDGCKALPVVTIPFGVEGIGKEAFKGCSLLAEVDIPGSVKYIDSKAFANCASLVVVRIPSTLKSLGAKAFENCRLLDVLNELPGFVTENSASFYCINSAAVEKYLKRNKTVSPIQEIPAKSSDYAASRIGHTSSTPSAPTAVAPKNNAVIDHNFVPDEVDLSVPFTNRVNDKTFAVIISNENYSRMEKVPFAINDGEIFRQYCVRTLGIPSSNVFMYTDATAGIMQEALSDLRAANRIAGNSMKVIFYYSGHGAPDEVTRDSYLIPVDASRVNPAVCMSLQSVYEALGALDIESGTVFIDACFSGGERNGGTLMASTGERAVVRVKPKTVTPVGNVVSFSATTADQTALPYAEKGHGIFTYHLLKKLKDTNGSVSLAELMAYLGESVNRTAFSVNRREQTPTFQASPSVASSWQNWRLNQ